MIFLIKLDQTVIKGGEFESDVIINFLSRREESCKNKLFACLLACLYVRSVKKTSIGHMFL